MAKHSLVIVESPAKAKTIGKYLGKDFEVKACMHRNTFLNSPGLLNRYYQLKNQPRISFAGQMTGVEGYVESAASGFLAGVETARRLQGKPPVDFPQETAIGALGLYVSNPSVTVFQPMALATFAYQSSPAILKALWLSGVELKSGGAISGTLAEGSIALFSKVASIIIFTALFVVLLTVALRLTVGALIEKHRSRLPYEEETGPIPAIPLAKEPAIRVTPIEQPARLTDSAHECRRWGCSRRFPEEARFFRFSGTGASPWLPPPAAPPRSRRCWPPAGGVPPPDRRAEFRR